MKPYEALPTGKVIIRNYDPVRSLLLEQHSYGVIDICISYTFKGETKVEEVYMVKNRIVSCRTYEKARTAYADMPAADPVAGKGWDDLLRRAAKEQRQHNAEAKKHQPNPDEARQQDAFCTTIMANGKCVEATQWIQTKNHTLGELDWSGSKRLVSRLAALGSVHVYACEIDVYEDGAENTGHLVIELPKAAAARGKILKMIDRLAREQGYEGPFEEGQQYAYVKLD